MTTIIYIITILIMAKIIIPFCWNFLVADLVNIIISPFTDWRIPKMKK